MRRVFSLLLLLLAATTWTAAQPLVVLPNTPFSLKFAVIGDNGTGMRPQYEVADQMALARSRHEYEMVVMVGDNMYGRQEPEDFILKFRQPYAALLDAGVRFYATLGNHDDESRARAYQPFNMNGERYYTYARKNVRFFVFDTNAMDARQIAWIDETLGRSTDEWKIAVFHHPIYSDGGRHGSNVELRVVLEPLLTKHGVAVGLTGHEHFYERLRPQKGITYFIAGSGGQLRKGDVHHSAMTGAAFDRDRAFMLIEIAGDTLFFQAIARTGAIVDSGVISRRSTT